MRTGRARWSRFANPLPAVQEHARPRAALNGIEIPGCANHLVPGFGGRAKIFPDGARRGTPEPDVDADDSVAQPEPELEADAPDARRQADRPTWPGFELWNFRMFRREIIIQAAPELQP